MKVLFLAGEASGDRMAANVLRALRRLRPDVEASAMGGAALREAGARLVVDSTHLAVVGISEVVRVLPELLRARSALRRELAQRRPDVVVPVDYPDFNVRIALHARSLGVPVAWLVSPQVWAWRGGRVPLFARAVSRMLVLFPFELEPWRRAGVPAEHVGHPLLDLPAPPSREEARDALGLPADARVLALLPGSRRSEIARTWPVFAEAAARLAATRPDLRCAVPLAPGIGEALLPWRAGAPLLRVRAGMTAVTAACDAALVASGTATLETALVPRALVVGYRVSGLTMALSHLHAAKGFVERGLFSLPNLVLGRRVVPELYQDRFDAAAAEAAIAPLLDDPAARAAMVAELAELRPALGGPGAHERVALAVIATAGS